MLLQGVREVCALVNASEPLEVSQRAFDAARPQSSHFKDLPTARNIAGTLRLPWGEVLKLAQEPPGVQNHRLSRKQDGTSQDWLTLDYVAFALKLVASHLKVKTLTTSQYRIGREAVLKPDQARWLHGRQLLLPTFRQIRFVAGDWDKALALADLASRPGLGDQRLSKPAPGTVEMLERCYAVYGVQPSASGLKTFARANGIPYRKDVDKTWLESVAEWKAQRQAKGLPVPDGRPQRDKRPDYGKDVGASLPGERRRGKWDNVEDCIPYVQRYLEQLRPGERSTQYGYRDWSATQDPRPPHVSAFIQHGGWEAVRRKAQKRMGKRSGISHSVKKS
jgi:hypothetical protein